MPEGWRHDYANLVLGGGNLLLLLVGFNLRTVLGWEIALGSMAALSFWAWYANLTRYRLVADTPTARIASAPQGYIEIVGRGKQPPGDALVSPLNGLPCLWYRYRIEQKNDDQWETVETRLSHDTFGVDDGSGWMLVDPDEAEILTSHKQVSEENDYRYTEWTLIAGETLYVIGEHVTLGGANAVLNKSEDVAALLAEWKMDRATLLARFDANKDGEIDLDEWEAARRAAAAEIDRSHFDIRQKDGVHLMRKARHRPFLIANRKVESLIRHYQLWLVYHLVTLAVAIGGLIYIASNFQA